tara:strand:- start:42 stop:581 length:540 start_codon:yes stop_codon:yes gene_type:complete
MNIIKLNNNKTPQYEKLKDLVLSPIFPWFNAPSHGENPESSFRYFSHIFLSRPNQGSPLYSESKSQYTPLVNDVLTEIFFMNNMEMNISCLYRANANLLPPVPSSFLKSKRTMEHVDHDFPHNNLLIYLTDAGGKTIVGNESHDPKEDDIIMFPGLMHCIETSHTKDRVVLVVTFGTKK